MDLYVLAMHSLALFQCMVLSLSLFLLLTVRTKLTPFSRFVIHGHDFMTAGSLLYMTLGTVPNIVLPCASGYPSGLFTRFGIMSTLNQTWSQVLFLAIASAFSVLLTINRTFAVSQRMERWKHVILGIFFGQSFLQVVTITIMGVILDGGVEARKLCQQKLKLDYPVEMYSHRGLHLIASEESFIIGLCAYIALITTFYLTIITICGMVLIRGIRDQARSSQSVQFLANQRKITIGDLYIVILSLVAVGIPCLSLSFCMWFSVGNINHSRYAFITMSFYPIVGPLYVLMSNTDYRNRIRSIMNARQFLEGRSLRVHWCVREQLHNEFIPVYEADLKL